MPSNRVPSCLRLRGRGQGGPLLFERQAVLAKILFLCLHSRRRRRRRHKASMILMASEMGAKGTAVWKEKARCKCCCTYLVEMLAFRKKNWPNVYKPIKYFGFSL